MYLRKEFRVIVSHYQTCRLKLPFLRFLTLVVGLQGPDYNSESETEKAAEAARLSALLKDWETASAGSRSLPTTPKRRPKPPLTEKLRADGVRSAEISRDGPRPPERSYVSQVSSYLL
jgi:hypothetical protein